MSTQRSLDLQVEEWQKEALSLMGMDKTALLWRWNPSLTSIAGRAQLVPVPNLLEEGKTWWCPMYLEFSPHVIPKLGKTGARDTVFHEVAHAVDAFLGNFNPRRPHGRSWKELMVKAGIEAPRATYTLPIKPDWP